MGKNHGGKQLIATGYESQTALEGVYSNLGDTLAESEGCGAQVKKMHSGDVFTENVTTVDVSMIPDPEHLDREKLQWPCPCRTILEHA